MKFRPAQSGSPVRSVGLKFPVENCLASGPSCFVVVIQSLLPACHSERYRTIGISSNLISKSVFQHVYLTCVLLKNFLHIT